MILIVRVLKEYIDKFISFFVSSLPFLNFNLLRQPGQPGQLVSSSCSLFTSVPLGMDDVEAGQ